MSQSNVLSASKVNNQPKSQQLDPHYVESQDSCSSDSNHNHHHHHQQHKQHHRSPSRRLSLTTTNHYVNQTNSCSASAKPLRPERYSLKRPPPIDSPCSFPSSPAKLGSQNLNGHMINGIANNYAHLTASPPMLISDVLSAPAPAAPPPIPAFSGGNASASNGNSFIFQQSHPNLHLRRPSDSNLNFKYDPSQTVVYHNQNPTNLVTVNPSSGLHSINNISFTSNLLFTNHSTITQASHLQPQPQQHHIHLIQSDNSHGLFYNQSNNSVMGINRNMDNFNINNTTVVGVNGPVHLVTSSTQASVSGKSTPRQPAKKRLEARTPTIEGTTDDNGINTTSATMMDSNESEHQLILSGMQTQNTFKVHQNTPFGRLFFISKAYL